MGRDEQERLTAVRTLGPREAEVFAGLADVYCHPAPPLPPVAQTDAIAFIDDLAAGSRRLNRIGFRLILRIVDLAPLARGQRARFHALGSERRLEFVQSLERSRWLLVKTLAKLLKTLTLVAYYGDVGVLRRSGYDPQANVQRGRELRAREGRP